MNILAEEQKKIFEKGITEEEREERKESFLRLYFELREKEEQKWGSKLTLEQRKKLYWLIYGIYSTKNRLGGFSYKALNQRSFDETRPIIFAITHVGKYDIEIISESIKKHYYLLSGDFEHLQGTIDAAFLGMNGVFYFNEFDKSDKKRVVQTMIDCLLAGGNLMYFIEGTWNMSPNLPVLPCYWGIIDVARKGNAVIIPIGAEQYGKKFVIKYGENFEVNNYEDSIAGKTQAITDLRDILATLKWEVWEDHPIIKREDIIGDEWDKYKAARYAEWPYFNDEYIDRLIFKPKGVYNQEEVFAPIRKLSK